MNAVPANVSETRRPRLGFLGVGWIGGNRLKALAACEAAEIAAIVDRDPAAAKAAAAAAPGAEVMDSLDALLKADLDGLVIATPSGQHAEQAIAALRRGLAVYCQKPLARTADETHRVVEAARHAGRLLAVDFCYRTVRGMHRLRELVRSGTLGEIYAAELIFHNAYGPDKPWFYDREQSGGGCMMDLGIHLLDLARWVLDYPRIEGITSRLYAHGRRLELPTESLEDYASAELEFPGGTCVRLACSWNLSAGRDCRIEAAFYGTRSGARLYNVNGSFYDLRVEHLRGTARQELGTYPDDWGGRALLEWCRRLSLDPGFDAQAAQLTETAAAIDTIYGH